MVTPAKAMLVAVSVLFAILSVLVAYFWPILSNAFPKLFYNPKLWPQHASANLDKKCTVLDKSLFGCEDIVVHGDFAYLACSSRESRDSWFPPMARLYRKSPLLKDPFYVYDLVNNKLTKLNILRLKSPDLTLHGIAVHDATKPNKIVLAAVNHRRTGSCVELFDHRTGTDELIHTESVCDPLIYSPNGIAMTGPRSFYVTNFISKDASAWTVRKELLMGLPTGSIAFRDGPSNTVKQVRDGLKAPNGITLMNKQTLATVETSANELAFWSIQADQSVRQSGPKLHLDLQVDNISLLQRPEGGIIVTGPIATWPYVMAEMANFTYPGSTKPTTKKKSGKEPPAAVGPGIPSAVVVVHNSTNSKEQFFGHQFRVTPVIVDPRGLLLYGASVAAVHWPSKRAFIGGPYMRGVVVCPWPDPLPVAKGSKLGDKVLA